MFALRHFCFSDENIVHDAGMGDSLSANKLCRCTWQADRLAGLKWLSASDAIVMLCCPVCAVFLRILQKILNLNYTT